MTRLVWLTPIIFIAVMLGGVGVAQATGAWITSGKPVVAAGALSAEDVKGSMTLQQAADGLGVPYAELVALIGAADPSVLTPSTAFKDLEALVPGFSLSEFRITLSDYLTGGTEAAAPVSTVPTVTPTPTGVPTPTSTPTGVHTGAGEATGTGTGAGRSRTR